MMEMINNNEQLCCARKLKFYDGRERGENIITIENGCLSFTILQDRGLDIYDLRHRGTNISFLSKSGLCGFNSDFNTTFNGGMLYTCGLDSLGRREGYPTHGKYHNTPAKLISLNSDEKGVEIVRTVWDSGLFQNNLQLERTISCKYNSSVLNIKNRLTNLGYKTAEYCLLFHINLGYPMIDKGVKIDAPIIKTVCNKDNPEKRISKCLVMDDPKADLTEECFYHKGSKGSGNVINDKLKKQVTICYDEKKLPCLVEWKSMVSGDYALGIEPSTTKLDSTFYYNTIKSQEQIDFDISIEISEL